MKIFYNQNYINIKALYPYYKRSIYRTPSESQLSNIPFVSTKKEKRNKITDYVH